MHVLPNLYWNDINANNTASTTLCSVCMYLWCSYLCEWLYLVQWAAAQSNQVMVKLRYNQTDKGIGDHRDLAREVHGAKEYLRTRKPHWAPRDKSKQKKVKVIKWVEHNCPQPLPIIPAFSSFETHSAHSVLGLFQFPQINGGCMFC